MSINIFITNWRIGEFILWGRCAEISLHRHVFDCIEEFRLIAKFAKHVNDGILGIALGLAPIVGSVKTVANLLLDSFLHCVGVWHVLCPVLAVIGYEGSLLGSGYVLNVGHAHINDANGIVNQIPKLAEVYLIASLLRQSLYARVLLVTQQQAFLRFALDSIVFYQGTANIYLTLELYLIDG